MNYLRAFDQSIINSTAKLPHWVKPVMTGATYAGSPVVAAFILLTVMAATYPHHQMHLLVAEAAILALLPLAGTIKLFTRRSRPQTLYAEHMKFKTYSFPSGHAYAALLVFGFCVFLSLHYGADPWKWLLAGLLAGLILLVGISRIYLGAHFPSDILGGWLMGGLVLFLVIKSAVKL